MFTWLWANWDEWVAMINSKLHLDNKEGESFIYSSLLIYFFREVVSVWTILGIMTSRTRRYYPELSFTVFGSSSTSLLLYPTRLKSVHYIMNKKRNILRLLEPLKEAILAYSVLVVHESLQHENETGLEVTVLAIRNAWFLETRTRNWRYYLCITQVSLRLKMMQLVVEKNGGHDVRETSNDDNFDKM